MYEYQPPHRNRIAFLLTGTLFVLSFCAFFSGEVTGSYRMIGQLFGIALLSFAVLILVRYCLKSFCYRLVLAGEDIDFVVIERTGKKQFVTCRIGLSQIFEIVQLTDENRESVKKRCQKIRHYDYRVDLGRVDTTVLFLNDSGSQMAIFFSPDAGMLELFRRNTNCRGAEHQSDE